jgi:hypothetical protein
MDDSNALDSLIFAITEETKVAEENDTTSSTTESSPIFSALNEKTLPVVSNEEKVNDVQHFSPLTSDNTGDHQLKEMSPSDDNAIAPSKIGGTKRKKTATKKEDIPLSADQLEKVTLFIQQTVGSDEKTKKPIFKFVQPTERIRNYTHFIEKVALDATMVASLEEILQCDHEDSMTASEREKSLIKEFFNAMKTSILENFEILTWFHQALVPKQKRPKMETIDPVPPSDASGKAQSTTAVMGTVDHALPQNASASASAISAFCSQFKVTSEVVVEQLIKSNSVDDIMDGLSVGSGTYFRSEVEAQIDQIRKEMTLLAPVSSIDVSFSNILTCLKKNLTDANQRKLILKALNGFIIDHVDELSFDNVIVPVNTISLLSMKRASESELLNAIERIEEFNKTLLESHRKKELEAKRELLFQKLAQLENLSKMDEVLLLLEK